MRDASVALRAPLRLRDRNDITRRFPDAFRVRPWIYWSDMVASALLGWALFFLAVAAPLASPLHALATAGAIFALLRAALFIHELAHLKRSELPGFDWAWSALVGVPVLVPSFMYSSSHLDHHRPRDFGTSSDPEYAPIAHWSRLGIAFFVATVAFVPVLLVLRWGLFAPLSAVCPPLRRLLVERASTLVINTRYRRPAPTGARKRRWAREEAAAAALVWAVGGGAALGWIPLALIGHWLVVAAGVLVVNQVRTLAAHGYENPGVPVDREGQLLDSINITGWSWLTVLVAPVGLRYHALHHYLPSLPYHSLGRLHRQLLAELPADAAYHRTARDSLLEPVQKLWNEAQAT